MTTIQGSADRLERTYTPPPPPPPPPPAPAAPRALTDAEVQRSAREVVETGQRTLWTDDYDARLDKLAEATTGLDAPSRVRVVQEVLAQDPGAVHYWLDGPRLNDLVAEGRVSADQRRAVVDGVAGAYNGGQLGYTQLQTFLGVSTQFAPALAPESFQGARDLLAGRSPELDTLRANLLRDSFSATARRQAEGLGFYGMDSAFAVTLAQDAGTTAQVAEAFQRLDPAAQRAVAADLGRSAIGYRNSQGEIPGLADPLATLTGALRSANPATTEAGRQVLARVAEGLLATRDASLQPAASALYREIAEGRAQQQAGDVTVRAQGLARVADADAAAQRVLSTLSPDATPAEVWDAVNRNHAAVVAPTFTQYLELRGDAARSLQGASLRNEIGLAMGLAPDRAPANADEEAAFAAGRFDYFGGEGLRAVQAVEAQILAVGGTDSRVTALPVTVASPELGLVQVPLYRVEGADGREQFVDYNPATGESRTYRDFEDWRSNNRLPPGQMTYAANGHLTAGADGRPQTVTENTPETPDTFWENWGRPVLDGAALVGGVVLVGAAIVGSGGTALIVGGALVGGYGVARGGEELIDRSTHGQTVNPLESAEARNAWINVGAGVIGFAAAGSSLRLATAASRTAGGLDDAANLARLAQAARATNVAAQYADTAALVDTGYSLAANWDRLTPQQRVSALAQMAFWSGGTAVAARQSGGLSNLYGVGDMAQALGSTNRWLRDSIPAGSEIRQVYGATAENIPLQPGERVVDLVSPEGQRIKAVVEGPVGPRPDGLSPLPGVIDASRLGRDAATGLITHIDGQPYQAFVDGLVTQRASEYRVLRQTGVEGFSNAETGPVVSVVVDRRTGQVFEGVNTQITNPDRQLDPLLLDRLQALRAEAREHGPYIYGDRGSGPFPHPSDPATHAEISAVNQAILARRARGEDVTWADLQRDLFYDNAFLSGSATRTAPTCANCTPLLDGIPTDVGHFTRFPPP